ncbi:MAG: hypothetical protein Q4P17_04035 [Methanobacterium sp.]|nr:hypothetical protein [Methanobacterium sp.]
MAKFEFRIDQADEFIDTYGRYATTREKIEQTERKIARLESELEKAKTSLSYLYQKFESASADVDVFKTEE